MPCFLYTYCSVEDGLTIVSHVSGPILSHDDKTGFFLFRGCAVGKSVRLACQGWVYESKVRQTYVGKTGIDSSPVKRSATGVSVTGPR